MIALCDLGLENLKRLQRMFEHLGYMAIITSDPQEISCCDCVVLCGRGSIMQGFKALKKSKLDKLIPEMAKKGRGIIGIGLGAHLLCRKCEEEGWYKGMELVPLDVVSGKEMEGFLLTRGSGELSGLDTALYYAQSGFVREGEGDATASFNGEFISAKINGNVVALWFYPHKSGEDGINVMSAVLKSAERNGGAI